MLSGALGRYSVALVAFIGILMFCGYIVWETYDSFERMVKVWEDFEREEGVEEGLENLMEGD
jgi:hypothetical protein